MKKLLTFLTCALFSAMLASAANPTVGLELNGSGFFNLGDTTSRNVAYANPTELTVEAWVNYANLSGCGCYVLCNETAQNGGWVLRLDGNKINFTIGDGTGWVGVSNTVEPKLGIWYHVAATYTATTLKLYVDGSLVGEKALTNPMKASTKNLMLGEGAEWGGRQFKGRMADVRIWSVAKDAASVLADMTNTLTGTETGLLANWKMNEGTGDAIADVKASLNLTKPATVRWFNPEAAVIAPKNGLVFDGTGKIEVGAGSLTNAAIANPTAITVEAWVNYSKIAGGYLLCNEQGPNNGWVLRLENNRLDFTVGTTAGWKHATNFGGPMLDTWYHVAGVYEAGKVKLYVNGKLSTETTLDAGVSLIATTKALVLGEGSEWTGRQFRGKMSDARIWSSARTEEQIAADMTSTLTGTEEGLVANWKMNEAIGDTIVETKGALGLKKPATGVAWFGVPEVADPATGLVFDGTGNINLGAPSQVATLNSPTELTVEAWVNFSSLAGGYVLCNEQAPNNGWVLKLEGNKLDFAIGNSSGWIHSTNPIEPKLGTWYHVAGVYTATSTKLFVDGVQVAETALTTPMIATTKNLVLGEGSEWTGRQFRGKMSDVRIWSVAKDAAGIIADMVYPLSGTEANLVANWKMNEGLGTVIADAKGAFNLTRPTTIKWYDAAAVTFENPTNGLIFDGTSNISLGAGSKIAALTNPTELTVEAWVNYSALAGGYVLCNESDGSAGWVLRLEGNKLDFTLGNGTDWVHATSNIEPELGTWYHVAGVYTATSAKLFVNGKKVVEKALTAPMAVTTKELILGEGSQWTGRQFRGKVSDIRIWSVAKDAAGIATDMLNKLTGSEAGLLANWKMDEATGDVVGDTKGTFNLAKPATGITWFGSPDVADPSVGLVLDGTEKISLGAASQIATLNHPTALTVEAWVNYSALAGGYILCNESDANGGWVLRLEGNKLDFTIGNGSSWVHATNAVQPTLGTWYHVAGVYTTTSAKLFINGVQVAETALTTPMAATTKELILGEGSQWTGRQFRGKMSDVRIWSVAKDAAGIILDMINPLTGTEANLLANWKMNEGTGTAIADSKGTFNLTKPTAGITWFGAPVVANPAIGLEFKGNGKIDLGDASKIAAITNPTELTVEAWVNYSALAGGYILCNEADGNKGWVLRLEGNKLDFSIGNSTGWVHSTNAVVPELNTWYHVAGVYTTASTKLFINSVQVAETALTAPMNASGKTLIMGEGSEWTGRQLRGKVSDIRIWSVAKGHDAIAADMVNELIGTEAGLLANWKMDEGTGLSIADATGSFNLTRPTEVVWFGGAVGVDQIKAAKVDVFVSGQSLRLVNNTKSNLTFSVISLSGIKVLNAAVNAGETFEQTTNLNGVYLLKGVTQDGATFFSKVVLN